MDNGGHLLFLLVFDVDVVFKGLVGWSPYDGHTTVFKRLVGWSSQHRDALALNTMKEHYSALCMSLFTFLSVLVQGPIIDMYVVGAKYMYLHACHLQDQHYVNITHIFI